MKKSFHLGLCAYFESVPSLDHLARVHYSQRIDHAETSFWKWKQREAILQEFDGYQGYLYQFDVALDDSITVPIRIDLPDMHLLYLIQGSDISLLDQHGNLISDIHVRRARYLYLPPGAYTLHFPKGKTELFGLYFDGGLFRDGNERKFHFLHPLIQAYREQGAEPVYSVDFQIGPRTLAHIQYLCDNLRKGNFSNESFIMQGLTQLVELSREKVIQEESKIQYAQHIAEQARKLLKQQLSNDCETPLLTDIATQLNISQDYLYRVFKQEYGQSLLSYRNELQLAKAQKMLRDFLPVSHIAYALGYSSPTSFIRFFKKQTTYSPGEWQKRHRDL